MRGGNPVERELIERVARLEAKLEELSNDVKEVKEKLNGYLEHRVRTILKAFLGEILLATLTSSAVISFLVNLILRR